MAEAAADGMAAMTMETPREGGEDDYKPPEAKSVNELLATKEGEDEAMARYKASLLGAAAAGQGKSEDPRRVVITQLAVVVSPARQLPTCVAFSLVWQATSRSCSHLPARRRSLQTTSPSCST